jgi:hypothetical protein
MLVVIHTNMKLDISKERPIRDVQQDFNNQYPFLKLEFYKNDDMPLVIKKHLSQSASLKSAGLNKDGFIEITDEMKVRDLENAFLKQFGLSVQVSRKAGVFWLETTMTDNWSLQKQNEYGSEISAGPRQASS